MNKIKQHFRDDTSVTQFLENIFVPYSQQDRDCTDGPRNLDNSLQLSEDFYSIDFLHKFRRRYVFVKPNGEDGDDTDDNDEQMQKKRAVPEQEDNLAQPEL